MRKFMHLMIIFSFTFSLLLLTSCTTKTMNLEDARQLAADSVLKSEAYTQYDSYGFSEDYSRNLSTGSYEFKFSFKTNDTNTKGYIFKLIVNDSKIADTKIVQIDDTYCKSYEPDSCPQGCIVCPPCPECSSIQCREESICVQAGFDAGWYNFSVVKAGHGTQCPASSIQDRFKSDTTCANKCGDGICDDTVCQDAGCTCEENKTNCPEDCGK